MRPFLTVDSASFSSSLRHLLHSSQGRRRIFSRQLLNLKWGPLLLPPPLWDALVYVGGVFVAVLREPCCQETCPRCAFRPQWLAPIKAPIITSPRCFCGSRGLSLEGSNRFSPSQTSQSDWGELCGCVPKGSSVSWLNIIHLSKKMQHSWVTQGGSLVASSSCTEAPNYSEMFYFGIWF